MVRKIQLLLGFPYCILRLPPVDSLEFALVISAAGAGYRPRFIYFLYEHLRHTETMSPRPGQTKLAESSLLRSFQQLQELN